MSLATSAVSTRRRGGFWRRVGAMILKEFLQLRRDRVTFATMITLPVFQLMLFGYAINTVPRNLPTAVLLQEQSDVGRSILAAMRNTKYFALVREVRTVTELDHLLTAGEVLFAVEIPANFERGVRRGDRPALLVAADATDPVASGTALGALSQVVQTALQNDRAIPDAVAPPFEIRTHARYNPGAVTLPNILLSGFAFPFLGMPLWAQWVGEALPLTHFIRIARGILLKGATIVDLQVEAFWLVGLMLVAMTIAVARFRRTLD